MYWYMTETSPEQSTQQQRRQPGSQRRRHTSDSSAHTHATTSAPLQRPRGWSSSDYDHLEHCMGPAPTRALPQRQTRSSSPLAYQTAYPIIPSHVAGRHQKTARSFDSAELPLPTSQQQARAAGNRRSVTKSPQHTVSFTAAAKGKRNGHFRSHSDPDDLGEATPTGHAHRSTKGSRSPCPQTPYYVNVNLGNPVEDRSTSLHPQYSPAPLISPSSAAPSKHPHQLGPGRRKGGRERGRDHTPHQRYPSSDDSQGRGGAEPGEQAPPRNPSKVCGGHSAWGTSQDSGFDSMSNAGTTVSPPLP
jgi:hypothetical protein